MINIKKIELKEIHLDLVEPFQISSGTTTSRRIMLLKFFDADGTTAWSECVTGETPIYSPETIDTAWTMITKFFAPIVLKNTFETPQEIHTALNKVYKGHLMAKAAIEMGSWGLYSLQKQRPLSKLLGGTQTEVPTGVSIGIQDSPEILVEKVAAKLNEKFHKIKIKIKPGFDLDYIKALRDKLGMDFTLMVDANNAYSRNDMNILKEMDQYNLLMIEQPLWWDDVYYHAEIQKELKTPVCLDESILTARKAQEMIDMKAGKIINIKPGRVGGLTESLAIHDLCTTHDIPVWCGGMLESGIGRSYNVALASLPQFKLPGDISPSKRYWKEDVVSPAWDMEESGMMKVNTEKPGLGVTIKEDYINSISTRTEVLQSE